ncbi:uncharacterized protein LOC113290664 [Papaver somniferum]|uniref:uncharacterized protein LOC113290664 n=1 Tax=Papaver somniferum TaxID=3469 RepID=UPI000E6FF483|nr:uncharacterized protein LOC113290664 [Papaver somniferum]
MGLDQCVLDVRKEKISVDQLKASLDCTHLNGREYMYPCLHPDYPPNYAISDNSMFVFSSPKGMLVLLLYVDDILLTGSSSSLIDSLITSLKQEFAMKELGELGYFLRIEAVRGPDSIVLTLQYLTITKPDICFGVNYVSQFMHSPSDIHLQLVKKILRYLKGTIGLGITLKKDSLQHLKAYTDSDWVGYPDTRRSTSGYAVFLGNNLVSWSTKKKTIVSKFSAEAEYKCMSVAFGELKWLVDMLSELHVSVETPTLLLCDNTSVLSFASNPVFHARTKHIEIQYHTIRELVEQGFLRLQHIASEDQITDIFTKGLCFPSFFKLLQSLMGVQLQGISFGTSAEITS